LVLDFFVEFFRVEGHIDDPFPAADACHVPALFEDAEVVIGGGRAEARSGRNALCGRFPERQCSKIDRRTLLIKAGGFEPREDVFFHTSMILEELERHFLLILQHFLQYVNMISKKVYQRMPILYPQCT
jgi:hypothetical protein